MIRQWHLLIGGLAVVVYQLFLENVSTAVPYPWLSGIALAAIGSVFPDVLEPAYSSNHRGIFHSRGILRLVSVAFLVTALITDGLYPLLDRGPAYLASCFLLGYLSHLLADATTARGLPR
jgi:membrane-bound metal-dependent hydrolase YbcI (DUF457 family)